MDQVCWINCFFIFLNVPKKANLLAASRFRIYALNSLVCDFVDFFKEIGRENSLLAERWSSPKSSIEFFSCLAIIVKLNKCQSPTSHSVSEASVRSSSILLISHLCDMRLFVAIASFEREGSIVPYALGLKLCGEHKVLDLLADTFALWSQNLQVLFDFKAMAITSLNFFFFSFAKKQLNL